jgi:hypothetical protein
MKTVMSNWREDFNDSSLQEVLESQAENRVWSKELRRQSTLLVNSRLAKVISQADYLSTRSQADKDAIECRRRANILQSHLVRHAIGPLRREN